MRYQSPRKYLRPPDFTTICLRMSPMSPIFTARSHLRECPPARACCGEFLARAILLLFEMGDSPEWRRRHVGTSLYDASGRSSRPITACLALIYADAFTYRAARRVQGRHFTCESLANRVTAGCRRSVACSPEGYRFVSWLLIYAAP